MHWPQARTWQESCQKLRVSAGSALAPCYDGTALIRSPCTSTCLLHLMPAATSLVFAASLQNAAASAKLAFLQRQ